MLKKSLKDFNYNIFEELNTRWGILTAGDKTTGFNAMTVSWGGIGVLWGKMVGYVFVRKSRYTYQFIEKSDSVTLSFLPDNLHKSAAILGTLSGCDTNKMEEAQVHYTYDPDFDGAYIKEASYVLKMKKIKSVDIPYEDLPEDIIARYYPEGDEHTMYVCEIKQFLEKDKERELH